MLNALRAAAIEVGVAINKVDIKLLLLYCNNTIVIITERFKAARRQTVLSNVARFVDGTAASEDENVSSLQPAKHLAHKCLIMSRLSYFWQM